MSAAARRVLCLSVLRRHHRQDLAVRQEDRQRRGFRHGTAGERRRRGGAGFGVRARPGVPHFLCDQDLRSRGSLQAHPAILWQFEIVKSRLRIAADSDVLTATSESAMLWTWRFLPVRSANSIRHPEIRLMRLSIIQYCHRRTGCVVRQRQRAAAGARRHPECQGGQNVGFVVGSATSCNAYSRAKAAVPSPTSRPCTASALDLGFTEQTRLTWAVIAPTSAGRSRRSRRQLRRRRRQRVGRGRRRRQCAGRRSGEHLRAAADQPAGPDRAERRRRRRRYRSGAGRLGYGGRAVIITGITITAEIAAH